MQQYLIRVGKGLAVAAALWISFADQGMLLAANPDEPVASVNGELITQRDLELEKTLYRVQIPLSEDGAPHDAEPTDIGLLVEKLIDRKLLVQKATDAEITITASMVNARFRRLKNGFSDEKAFQRALEDSGLNEAELELLIEQGLAIEYLLDHEIFRHIFVSLEETKDYYQKHRQDFVQPEVARVSQIMIQIPSSGKGSRRTTIEKMNAIRERIENGDNFSALAVEYSNGPNRYLGGDLGYVSKEDLPPYLGNAAFSLEPGEIGPVIETETGIHLLKVVDKKPAQILPFPAVQKEIEALLTLKKQEYTLSRYLDDLKKKAVIERYAVE